MTTFLLWAALMSGPIDLSKWSPPVLTPVQIELTEDIHVMDQASHRIMIYSGALEAPSFKGQTPGLGQGPGEFETKPMFMAIAPDGGIWVSYLRGINQYDSQANFIKGYKKNIGIACIGVDQRFYRTWGHGWHNPRPALTAYAPDLPLEHPLWEVDNPDGTAYMKNGDMINPAPVFLIEGEVIHYVRPYHREYMKIRAKDGNILLSTTLYIRFPPEYEPAGRLTEKPAGETAVVSFEHCPRGWARDASGLWLGVPDYESGDRSGALICLDTNTGKIKHRLKPGLERFQLVTLKEGRFLLLDKDEGRLIWWSPK